MPYVNFKTSVHKSNIFKQWIYASRVYFYPRSKCSSPDLVIAISPLDFPTRLTKNLATHFVQKLREVPPYKNRMNFGDFPNSV